MCSWKYPFLEGAFDHLLGLSTLIDKSGMDSCSIDEFVVSLTYGAAQLVDRKFSSPFGAGARLFVVGDDGLATCLEMVMTTETTFLNPFIRHGSVQYLISEIG